MKKARKGDTVVVDFSGHMENGIILSAPLTFTIGRGEVLPVVEDAVIGLSPGEQAKDRADPDMVFGNYQEDLVREIGADEVPELRSVLVGSWMEITRADGEVVKGTVQKVSKATVVIDTNHPLAGNCLEYWARLREILP